jgi:hypothetical protein
VTHTTPARLVDLESVYPGLRSLARPATRLHPRRGTPSAGQSSIGGPPLWPAGEPWPACHSTTDHDAGIVFDLYRDNPFFRHGEPGKAVSPPLTPALQLYVRDVPGLPHPQGADLLQILWCPLVEWHAYDDPVMLWRDSASIGERLDVPPLAHSGPGQRDSPWTIPFPCTIDAEENAVADYPFEDAPADLFERLRKESHEGWPAWELAVVPGCKIGGYPTFGQPPHWPACPGCQRTMRHLLTLMNDEGGRRWIPVEEWETAGYAGGTEEASARTEAAKANRHPLDIDIYDNGMFNVFYCPDCPGMPLASWTDSP